MGLFNSLFGGSKVATTEEAGIVQIGENINVSNGIISVPKADDQGTAGVVQAGTGINISQNGIISVQTATNRRAGAVKIGKGITVTDDGTISVTLQNGNGNVNGKIEKGIMFKNGAADSSTENFTFNGTTEFEVEPGNGINITFPSEDPVTIANISLKVASDSESYLTVNENGIAIKGIDKAITDIKNKLSNSISIKYNENIDASKFAYDDTFGAGLVIIFNPYDNTISDCMTIIGKDHISLTNKDNSSISILDADYDPASAAAPTRLATENAVVDYVKTYINAKTLANISIKYGEDGEEWAKSIYDETNNKGIIITYNPYDKTVTETNYTIGGSKFSLIIPIDELDEPTHTILDAEFSPNGAACTDTLATEEGVINFVKEYVSAYVETKISDKLSTISTMITVDNFNDAGIPIYDPNTNQISQSHAWVGKETISLDENGNPDLSINGNISNADIGYILATEEAVIKYVKEYVSKYVDKKFETLTKEINSLKEMIKNK